LFAFEFTSPCEIFRHCFQGRWLLFRQPNLARDVFGSNGFVVKSQSGEIYRPMIPLRRVICDLWLESANRTSVVMRSRLWLAHDLKVFPQSGSHSSLADTAPVEVPFDLVQQQPDFNYELTVAERETLDVQSAVSLYLHRTSRLIFESITVAVCIGADKRPAELPHRDRLMRALSAVNRPRSFDSLFINSPSRYPKSTSFQTNSDAEFIRVVSFTCTPSELDLYAHMNQAQYFLWYQRALFLHAMEAAKKTGSPSPSKLVARGGFQPQRVSVWYLREIKCGDEIEIWARANGDGVELEMRRAAQVVSRAAAWGGVPQQLQLKASI
jgi:acyl-CoA thioesterase FadM